MGIKRTKPSRPTASERCSLCVNDFFQFCAVAVHATAGSLFVPARKSSGLASDPGGGGGGYSGFQETGMIE